jgi:23S rRNA (pseudouridine1915-N3)-methyltransferase
VSRYTGRLAKSGKALGLEFDGLTEFPKAGRRPRNSAKSEEAAKCAVLASEASDVLILLDERGKSLSSRQFAGLLADYRDERCRHAPFSRLAGRTAMIRPCARADRVIAFGNQTWPHQLARIMLAEQLYRSVTILSGHPYHRD